DICPSLVKQRGAGGPGFSGTARAAEIWGRARGASSPVPAPEKLVNPTVSVVMPAFAAAPYVAEGVRSVLAQTWPHWRLVVISDDGTDYEVLLAGLGLRDSRFRFLTTGRVAAGASHARNLALETVDTDYVAILDADDRFKPGKLARAVAALETHAVVTSALEVMDEGYRPLRRVGAGPDRVLPPAAHKFVCLS